MWSRRNNRSVHVSCHFWNEALTTLGLFGTWYTVTRRIIRTLTTENFSKCNEMYYKMYYKLLDLCQWCVCSIRGPISIQIWINFKFKLRRRCDISDEPTLITCRLKMERNSTIYVQIENEISLCIGERMMFSCNVIRIQALHSDRRSLSYKRAHVEVKISR